MRAASRRICARCSSAAAAGGDARLLSIRSGRGAPALRSAHNWAAQSKLEELLTTGGVGGRLDCMVAILTTKSAGRRWLDEFQRSKHSTAFLGEIEIIHSEPSGAPLHRVYENFRI